MTIIFSIAAPITQNKVTFFIVRSLAGLSMGIIGPTLLTITAEIVKSSHREIGPLCISFSVHLPDLFVAMFAYFLLDLIGWRWFIVTQSVVPLIICLTLVIGAIQESPRYLMVSGHDNKAVEILQQMAKKNGKSLPQHLNIDVPSKQNRGSISDILKSDFRKESILLSIMYFGDNLLTMGLAVFLPLALYSGFCGGQEPSPPLEECASPIQQKDLLQLCIATSVPLFGTLLGYSAAKKLGRSVSLKIFATTRFIIVLFFFKCFSQIGTLVLFCVLQLLQLSFALTSSIIMSELYPTIFRSTAIASISSFGKLGGVVGSAAVYGLYYINPLLVVAIFALCALLVTVAAWIWDKETKNIVINDVRDNLDNDTE